MSELSVSAFPDNIRVALSDEGQEELWGAVDDAGGITAVAQETGYIRSNLYNWKHKSSFVPIDFVTHLLGADAAQYITAVKGGGRSQPLENPVLLFEADDELLTRVACSVYVNRDGVPTYQVTDAGLVDRFVTLLRQYGDVPIALYHRHAYELRYPKYLHAMFQEMAYETDRSALIDETGTIDGDEIIVDNERFPVNTFNGTLYHRGKKLQLALARGDSATITELMASEAQKVEELVR